MDEQELRDRTKAFALRVMKLAEAMPKTQASKIVTNQLLRCATSVGANYRAACRGRSKADFVSKIGIVEEEADESAYWLELIMENNLLNQKKVQPLHREAEELRKIFTSSRLTASRSRNQKSSTKNQK
ncbi:MAG: four helix bundle protein [Planctomycetota bacterium]